MLVYINHFELVGKNSCDEAFYLISKWLTKNANKKISKEFLKSGKELSIKTSHIRTYVADELEPYLYSILYYSLTLIKTYLEDSGLLKLA